MVEQAQQGKTSSRTRWIVRGVVIVILALVGVYAVHVQSATSEFNRIVEELINEGRHVEAAAALEELLDRPPHHMVDAIRLELGSVYRSLGDDPSYPLRQSAEFYRKSLAYDPDGLDPQQRKIMESGSAAPSSRPGPMEPVTEPATDTGAAPEAADEDAAPEAAADEDAAPESAADEGAGAAD